jgi:exonuclease III
MFPTSLRLASYNASGLIAAKQHFCLRLLEEQKIDILFVQETFWTEKTSTSMMSSALFHHLPFRSCQTVNVSGIRRRTKAKHGLAVLFGARLLPFKSQIRVIHEDEIWQSTLTIRVGDVLITNVYFPPSMQDDEWTDAFHAIPKVPPHDATTVHFLLGDWNARLMDLTGDTKSNPRASSFATIIQDRCLVVVPFTRPTGTFLNSRSQTSTPDFVLVTADHINSCSAVTVIDDDNGGSDHFPIMVDLVGNGSVENLLAQDPRRIALHLLKKGSRVCEAYSKEVNASLADVLRQYTRTWASIRKNHQTRGIVVQELLDELTTSLLSTLTSSAEKHCKQRKTSHGFSKSVLNNDTILADLREQRIILLRELKTCSILEGARINARLRLNRVNLSEDVLVDGCKRPKYEDAIPKAM